MGSSCKTLLTPEFQFHVPMQSKRPQTGVTRRQWTDQQQSVAGYGVCWGVLVCWPEGCSHWPWLCLKMAGCLFPQNPFLFLVLRHWILEQTRIDKEAYLSFPVEKSMDYGTGRALDHHPPYLKTFCYKCDLNKVAVRQ